MLILILFIASVLYNVHSRLKYYRYFALYNDHKKRWCKLIDPGRMEYLIYEHNGIWIDLVRGIVHGIIDCVLLLTGIGVILLVLKGAFK